MIFTCTYVSYIKHLIKASNNVIMQEFDLSHCT